MLKKTIKFKDYNGVDREEDFYFNLNKAELTEMELGQSGGFSAYILNIIKTQDIPTLIKYFKELILKAYGKKSEDGRRFIKSPELTKEFTETEAYVNLYMELANDAQAAADFAKGIIPADLAKQAEEEAKKNPEIKKVTEAINMPETKNENNTSKVENK